MIMIASGQAGGRPERASLTGGRWNMEIANRSESAIDLTSADPRERSVASRDPEPHTLRPSTPIRGGGVMSWPLEEHGITLPRDTDRSASLPWEVLVEPSQVFSHPREVLAEKDLTREEKRAILASWASDAWAVESAPGLRHCPGVVNRYVSLDSILDALGSLDPEPGVRTSGKAERDHHKRRSGVRWLTPRLSRLG
jgi:hypothetical protein